jgi:hypothetical protein
MIQRLLQRWASKMTYRPIPDRDDPDEVYLRRYYKTEEQKDSWWFLHNFRLTDRDYHHNHPYFWQFSVILTGSYDEEVMDAGTGKVTTHRRRWFNWIDSNKYHKIVKIYGDTWTIFVLGPKTGRSWGFWIPGYGHVHHEKLNEVKAQIDRLHWSEAFRKGGAVYVN